MGDKSEKKEPLWVSFFLYLAKSKRYNALKATVKDTLKNPKNPYKNIIDSILIFFIISSVVIFIYEVKNPLSFWMEFYAAYFVSAVFAIEYLLNLWLYNDIREDILKEYDEAHFLKRNAHYFKVLLRSLKKKISYIFTLSAIIDLLAILPAYRPLRIFKIFVLFRFLKILRHSRSIYHFIEVLSDRKFELFTLLMLFVFVVLVGAIAIYVVEEPENNGINNLFGAIYWSFITATTVGYGDVSPVTPTGKVITFIIVILGLIMIAFGTSVIVSAFSEKLHQLKEERIAEHLLNQDEYLIICGYGQMTKVLINNYKKYSRRFIILDSDPVQVQNAINDGYNAIYDDASRYAVLSRFYNEESNIKVLALTGDDIKNISICLNAKSISKDIFVVSRASGSHLYNKYLRAGADRVVLPNEISAAMMVASVTRPAMYKALNAILHFRDVASINELYISSECKIVGKKLKEINLMKYNIIVFGIQKGSSDLFKFNPSDEYVLQEHDTVVILGDKMVIEQYKKTYKIGKQK